MTTTSKTITGIITALVIGGGIYVISPGSDGGVFKPDCSQYKPGDTLDMRGKNYTYTYFDGLKGAPGDSIVIIGGTLSKQLDLKNCQYVKALNFTVDQNNDPALSGTPGISVHGKSAHMRFTNFKIINSGYGAWVKNEGDTSTSSWVLDGFEFDNFTMTNLHSHGFYAGATNYPNTSRPITLNGVVYYPNPSLLANINIHDGKIRSVGRNGVMLCIASTGNNQVHHMNIDTTGLEPFQDQQGSCIQLGGFTSAYVHDNVLNHSLLWGIRSFGGDTVKIENNTISNSGTNGQWSPTAWPAGYTLPNWGNAPASIAIGEDAPFTATGHKMFYSIKNNILGAPGKNGFNIQVWKGNYGTVNEICNNTGTISVDAGVAYLSNTCTDVIPIPDPIPTPTETYTGKKGYWVLDNKRVYYAVYKINGIYQIKTGDYTWYKSVQ